MLETKCVDIVGEMLVTDIWHCKGHRHNEKVTDMMSNVIIYESVINILKWSGDAMYIFWISVKSSPDVSFLKFSELFFRVPLIWKLFGIRVTFWYKWIKLIWINLNSKSFCYSFHYQIMRCLMLRYTMYLIWRLLDLWKICDTN